MANKDAAFGLRPLAKLGGNYNSCGFSTYAVKSGNNSGDIFEGAVVKLGSDGYVVVAGDSDTQILGVAGGIRLINSRYNRLNVKSSWCDSRSR